MAKPQPASLIVITDLDGTLLDHYDYSFDAALPVLALLQKWQIPVILNTSKTAAEVLALRTKLNNHYPFAIENGAALLWPQALTLGREEHLGSLFGHKMQPFGATRIEILAALDDIKRSTKLPIEGFADWSLGQVIKHTGLDPQAAEYAQQRYYSEPLLWQGDDHQLKRLEHEVKNRGLRLLKGGRFVHVIGQSDKGSCLELLKHSYSQPCGEPPIIIALGDGQNDAAMLELADHPVVVRSPVNPAPRLSRSTQQRAIYTQENGPVGWAQAVLSLLTQHGLT